VRRAGGRGKEERGGIGRSCLDSSVLDSGGSDDVVLRGGRRGGSLGVVAVGGSGSAGSGSSGLVGAVSGDVTFGAAKRNEKGQR
jgi:hypothetical protein